MAINDIDSTERMLGKPKTYEAVFTDKKDNAIVKPSDFLNLMIAQMKNQDFLNPMDDSQFVTQMAQFSTMQQMMELAEYSKTNYAMSLVGKTVTAARFTFSGALETTTGIVDKISLVNNEYVLYIGEKTYTLSQVMEVLTAQANNGDKKTDSGTKTEEATDKGATDKTGETEKSGGTGDPSGAVDPSGIRVQSGGATTDAAVIFWTAPTEDEEIARRLRYTVYYSTEGPFDTLDKVKKGAVSGSKERMDIKVDTVVGLKPGTEYYVNVVVKDRDGNESVYLPVNLTTAAVWPPEEQEVGQPEEQEIEQPEEQETGQP